MAAKLPFINEKKLLTETRKLENTLTPEEQARNSVFGDLLYVSPYNSLAPQISAYYNYFYHTHPSQRSAWQVDVFASGGMNCYLWLCQRNGYLPILPSPIRALGVPGASSPKPQFHVSFPLSSLTPLTQASVISHAPVPRQHYFLIKNYIKNQFSNQFERIDASRLHFERIDASRLHYASRLTNSQMRPHTSPPTPHSTHLGRYHTPMGVGHASRPRPWDTVCS